MLRTHRFSRLYQYGILITGCSDGGLGGALAIAFRKAGLHVYASARNPAKMTQLASLGIETLTLDVLSDSSIAACINKLSSFDILVNNAGSSYSMPVSGLPSPGMIVNQPSVVSSTAVPFQSAYNASKAAFAMFSDSQRLELQPFGVTVVDLKTSVGMTPISLPKGSIYEPAKDVAESTVRNDKLADSGMPAQQWARQVVQNLLKKNPPLNIWRGAQATLGRVGTFFPARKARWSNEEDDWT
ncbi:hypothetical protein B0J13DRAFT_640316 [Dactylonectria estremocensis]|uniref:NAD(P)-binding protein n=1 Tax=Dactylonectria estremocensis TaxID=1079267 RepID=A0A9P9IZM8_9HYPO|nr:hypothetical protein B0J13DRAFT_640316 [Dactylonectria estremocensis]